jgi:integrase
LAKEEAAVLEAQLLRENWHGPRRGVHPFAEAVESYLLSAPRSPKDAQRLDRILRATGDVPLSAMDQAQVNKLKATMLRPIVRPATVQREVVVPIRSVLMHAYRLGWCDPPVFEVQKTVPGRTQFLMPEEASRLVAAAAPRLQPLLTFLLCTGARMSEALELEWSEVDLDGARARFLKTKNDRQRLVELSAAAAAALAALPHREGRIFRTPRGVPYEDRERQYGGQIKTGWRIALRRAGITTEITPHGLRHTWATWHYAVHRDLVKLRHEGGWSTVMLVERYAHLMPVGQEMAIRAFWNGDRDEGQRTDRATA